MKNMLRKYRLELAGLIIGAALGWLYWYFTGCASGTCIITSSPVNSSLYGAILGVLLLGMFKKENKNDKLKNDNELRNLN